MDILKSGTRKEDLLVDKGDLQKTFVLRRILNPMGTTDAIEFLISKLKQTKTNSEFFDLALTRKGAVGRCTRYYRAWQPLRRDKLGASPVFSAFLGAAGRPIERYARRLCGDLQGAGFLFASCGCCRSSSADGGALLCTEGPLLGPDTSTRPW